MKIRAAVLQAIGAERPYHETRPLVIEELELDPPGENDVLVEIKAAGLMRQEPKDYVIRDGDDPW